MVWNMGRTPDLTRVRGTRRVHLAPRGTERHGVNLDAERDGTRGATKQFASGVYRACTEPLEAGCWWPETLTVGNLPDSFRKRS